MSLSQILIIATAVASTVTGFVANNRFVSMSQRVMRARPRKHAPFFWPSVAREHRELYPESRLPASVTMWTTLSVALLVLVILEWALFNRVGS